MVDTYSRTSGSFCQYYKDKTALASVSVANFPVNSPTFKF